MDKLQGLNIKDVVLIITGAVTIASVIVKITPTQKDDNVLNKALKILKVIGLYKKDS